MSTPEHPPPPRVLLWSAVGSGEHYAGPATFSYRLFNAAPPGMFQVTLAHGHPQQDDYAIFHRQVQVGRFGANPLAKWRFIRTGRRWVRANARDFDVFYGMSGFECTVAAAVEATRRGVPAIIFIANAQEDLADKPTLLKRLLNLPAKRRRAVLTMAGVVAMSRAIEQEMLGYGLPPSKIALIPNSVDTTRFHPVDAATRRRLRSELGWRDEPTVLFVGAVVRRKRPDLIVEAAGLLAREGLPVQVVLAGPEHEPEYARSIRTRCTQLGVADQVLWTGFTRQIEICFQAADVFCLPSSNEGMPGAQVEAMASALPAVVCDYSGARDLVTPGVEGAIVAQDARSIAQAIRPLITDATLRQRQGRAAMEKVVHWCSADRVVHAHYCMFKRVMNGRDVADTTADEQWGLTA